MAEVLTCLWFNNNAEEAVRFYTSVVRGSEVTGMMRHGGETGSVILVEFTLGGRAFTALNGGADFPFSEAVSIVLNCDTQEEADEYWTTFTDGGSEGDCGWCKDRYGLSWQIVPKRCIELLGHDDPEVSGKAMQAMMSMHRLDSVAMARAAGIAVAP